MCLVVERWNFTLQQTQFWFQLSGIRVIGEEGHLANITRNLTSHVGLSELSNVGLHNIGWHLFTSAKEVNASAFVDLSVCMITQRLWTDNNEIFQRAGKCD